MFGKENLKNIERKIDELSEKVRLISERQNSQYSDIIMQIKNENGGIYDNLDDENLYEKVKSAVIKAGRASTSYIQRKFQLGYARSARLMDLLEERDIIGEGDGAKPREVLIKEKE
ncbi:MAG: DNA translocase FtsK [Candidatus Paceibacterota bacterium]|jgi:S-DNA-T family DNA segregation ATPase FtsK/SpoIIIE